MVNIQYGVSSTLEGTENTQTNQRRAANTEPPWSTHILLIYCMRMELLQQSPVEAESICMWWGYRSSEELRFMLDKCEKQSWALGRVGWRGIGKAFRAYGHVGSPVRDDGSTCPDKAGESISYTSGLS